MTSFNGKFVWYELMTTDTAAAQKFYGSVAGWGAQDSGVPGMSYSLFTAGAIPVGGLMPIPEDARTAGASPGWMGYIAVDDVDAQAARVAKAGGKIHRPAQDIPGVGRFAIVADPQGAMFALFKGDGNPPEGPANGSAPGHAGWHELHAANGERAFAFYSDMFGWTKAETIDMGPMGVYQTFATGAEAVGGMMTKPPTEPHPYWLYYVNVAGIDAAAGRVTAGGGQVVDGPHQVPGGSWIIHGRDPQGAAFALVGPRG